MTPNQIADHLVEKGILTRVCRGRYTLPNVVTLDEDEILTDWRVAGKCLEAIAAGKSEAELRAMYYTLDVISDPQAICTAYCEATKGCIRDKIKKGSL